MKRHIQIFGILTMTITFGLACNTQVIQARPKEHVYSKGGTYEAVLGKSFASPEVRSFIVSNNCSSVGPYQDCKEAGMGLWIDSNQIVSAVYLYLNNDDGYAAYDGELPFGLKFYDTQGAVEYRLRQRGMGNNGRPDEGSSPDHFHYWAMYNEQNTIIIYNSPYEDEDATIYAIVVSR